jgi:hypothetical protein
MGTATTWEPRSEEEVKQPEQEKKNKSKTPSTKNSKGFPTQPSRKSPFLFISTNERAVNGKHNDESRMLVRSHVMSTFYQKKNSRQDEDKDRLTEVKGSHVGGKTSKFRLESYPQRRKSRRRKDKSSNPSTARKKGSSEMPVVIPQSLLGSGNIDPFGVAALPWDNHMQILVQHCRSPVPKI